MAKITKMQQRRGLRRDLPVPLAPGEFALATDSRELFIGSEVTDSLSGIHNRTIQIGTFTTGFDFASSHLQSNITEFIVKRDIITGVTGTGAAESGGGFAILSLHSALSPTAAHASGVKLEGGINDQTLTVHKYSPTDSSHALLLPGDPDGTPVVINDYKLVGGGAALKILFTKALVETDKVYIVHLRKKDLDTYLIDAFNASYDVTAGGGNALTDLTLKLTTDQFYFDESTGEGFIGFNNAQITTLVASKTVKTWFDIWISAADTKLNLNISAIGNTYWGDKDGTIADSSIYGGRALAKFGDDASTTVPAYNIDSNITFSSRSHKGAVNLSKFLNHAWLSEGSDPTRQLTHMRSNIRVVTETNVGDVFSNLTVSNPIVRTLGITTAVTGSNKINGTQVFRPVGSTSSTTQSLVKVTRYDLTTITNLEVDYNIVFDGTASSPAYYMARVGNVSIGFLLVNSANLYGHGAILDTWNEVDVLDSTGATTALLATQEFVLGVVVARLVTVKGDPVIENDHVTLSNASFQAKYGTTDNILNSQVFYVDNDTTSPTYQNYFGFLMYKNTRPVDGIIEFIQKRF